MKIGLSACGETSKDLLDQRFGWCEFFQIYDSESNEIKTVKNKGIEAEEGAGIAASNQIIDEEVEVVITGSLGPNAFKIIERAKIKAYKCDSLPIEVVLEKYNSNELEEIINAGAGHKGAK